MKNNSIYTLIAALFLVLSSATAQNSAKPLLSGYLQTDQRLLLKKPGNWAWNENRLSLQLNKKVAGRAKFHSEIWLRNMGLPAAATSADLFNKGIVDPWNLEIRDAYVRITGLFTPGLDVTIGRQRIAWGTADKFNPTDNVNPYDLEDILDFGRHRASDAISLQYYFNSDYSLQAVFLPFFQPWNMPVGVFSSVLTPDFQFPFEGMYLKNYSDTLEMPQYNFKQSTNAGFRFKGFAAGIDFSFSYLYTREGLPFSVYNSLSPADTLGGIAVRSVMRYPRVHIIGADFAANLFGAGLWAEAALYIPRDSVVMSTDISPWINGGIKPVTIDSTVLKKTPYLKFVIGADYSFANNTYLNVQFLHGFINERGKDNLNDYFIVRYEINLLNNNLKLVPLSGGAAITRWSHISDNYALFYVPEISYMATSNLELNLSAGIFGGKSDNFFSKLNDYDMVIFKMKYSF